MSEVFSFEKFQKLRAAKNAEHAFRTRIEKMEKAELLQEMLNNHDSFLKNPGDIQLTVRAQHIVTVLEQRAELKELQELSRTLSNKLKIRLYSQLQAATKT